MTEIKAAAIKEISQGGQYLRFSDGDCERVRAFRVDFNRCDFKNIRMKNASFEGCGITRCHFSHCYRPRASFVRTDLTGTKFVGCCLA